MNYRFHVLVSVVLYGFNELIVVEASAAAAGSVDNDYELSILML